MRIIIISFENELLQSLSFINLQNIDIAAIITVPTNTVINNLQKYKLLANKVYSYDNLKECLNDLYYDKVVVYGYDEYKLIDTLIEYGVRRKDIINLRMLRCNTFFSLYNVVKTYEKSPQTYENLITGSSYAYYGVNALGLKSAAIKFAVDSQDLYYGYKLAEKAINVRGGGGTFLKNILIQIHPYSFNYDVSRSVENYRCVAYYKILHDMHNFSITTEEADLFFSDMFKNIIPADNSVNIDDSMNLRQSQNYTVGLSGFIESRKRAENWKNKWYEDTISENINILQDYIELCLKNNIRPILVIYPCTSLYRKWFPKRMLNHFYYIISNMQKKYNIMILDCYASDKFDDIIDFRDSDHLNLSGAAKMTAIINEIL